MTGKTVEDLFFAADLRALRAGTDQVEGANTHEEVDEIRDGFRQLFDRLKENERKVLVPLSHRQYRRGPSARPVV